MRHRLTDCLSVWPDKPPSFIPCVTRTCRAGSATAAAADVVEQIGVGVVVKSGRHWPGRVNGKTNAVGICKGSSGDI